MSRSSNEKTVLSLNAWLATALGAHAAMLLWLVPLLMRESPAWGLLLIPLALLSNSLWAFIHEAVHGTMFADKRANRLIGRMLAIAYGASFDLLRGGHLLHHAHSRTRRERSEVYVGEKPSLGFVIGYYSRLLGGLYLAEMLASVLLLLPRRWLGWLGKHLSCEDNVIEPLTARLLEAKTLRAARTDAVMLIGVHGAALWLYGDHAGAYLACLAWRALAISLVDNVFHYGTALDRPLEARNLWLPASLSAFFLHFNLHGVHHRQPALSWRDLPAGHTALGTGYQGDFWSALARQLAGPLSERALQGSANVSSS